LLTPQHDPQKRKEQSKSEGIIRFSVSTKWCFGRKKQAQKRKTIDLSVIWHQLGEMLLPDPANRVAKVVLVSGKPELALLGNDIEDLQTKNVRISFTSVGTKHSELSLPLPTHR